MNQVLVAVGALLLGCAMRTLLPYVVKGLQELQNNKPWPKFEYSYLGSFGLVVVGYAVTFLTVQDAFSQVVALPFVAIVALAYFGQDAARLAIKFVKALDVFA